MRWDLNFIYPGLEMRVMPSTGPSGFLEFVMDPNHESAKAYSAHDIGTGKLFLGLFIIFMFWAFTTINIVYSATFFTVPPSLLYQQKFKLLLLNKFNLLELLT